jgi:putative CocE/NonD family hydrolase
LSPEPEWRWLPEWPPASLTRSLYLHPGGGLVGDVRPATDADASSFTDDPAHPTPAVGGQVINPGIGGYRDNRRRERRADVLTFTSEPLTEAIEVIGHPTVELAHHAENPQVDYFVRLCEVTKTGRSVNLSDGFRRLTPQAAAEPLLIRLDALAHRFAPGTRIRLQGSGGAHPRYARNLGTDEDPATGTRIVPSPRSICHGQGGFSRVLLPSESV